MNLNFSIFILDHLQFKEAFSLKNLGLTVLPLYNMQLINNEKNISFLPENNQHLIVYVDSKENSNINLDDIISIGIKNHVFKIEKNIIFNSINITLDLSWVKNENIREYQLYYIDKCATKIYTDTFISVIDFSVERNYFVLNNNLENIKTQRLIIHAPHSDYTKIYAYKDNSVNSFLVSYDGGGGYYYIDFNQNSKGVYSFKIINNEYELFYLSEKVYVFQNLNELLIAHNFPNCSFLDNDKKALKDIVYSIIIKDTDIVNNINIFKSRFISSENELFLFNEKNSSNTKKIFNLSISDNLKNKISTNSEFFIYLTENDFIDQPLYAFKIAFTNISLNSVFSEIIYTDANYISFDIFCMIDNLDSFYLKSVDGIIVKKLKCEQYSYYDNKNKNLKCFLSTSDPNLNPLLRYGESIFNYGYYILTYISQEYLISKTPFYLSHDIENADFALEKEKRIFINENTKIIMKTQRRIFYLPSIKRISYIDSFEKDNPIIANFIYVFNDASKYLFFDILVEYKHIYTINDICRIPCNYCRKSDCWKNPNNYTVYSNTKNIIFKFNRKYISLYNSTDLNYNRNTELKIEIGGEDKNKLTNLIVIYTSINGDNNEQQLLVDQNDIIKIDNLKPGKYEFKYKVQEEGELEEEYIVKNTVVLVANYDYEIFNFTELNKYCFYYNHTNNELYTSITPNTNYKFKNYVNFNDLVLVINNVVFEYSEKCFKKYPTPYLENNREYYNIIIKEKESQALIFTRISHPIGVTSFNLNPSINYFYKDNIITINQFCLLDNIYIRELDSNTQYYKLNCIYDNSKQKSYCETNYIFSNKKSIFFQFYVGNPYLSFYSKLNEIKTICNSIKDANFMISYNYPFITLSSNNFDMSQINYTKIDNNICIYSNSFLEQNSELIKFKFEKQNNSLTKNYITELIRINHPEDTSITEKNKYLNLEIIEKQCKEYEIKYLGICVTCEVFSKMANEFSDYIWYQNGNCVKQCGFSSGYGIMSRANHICNKCYIKILINNEYICGCPEGTIRSYIDNKCYLPESDEIRELLLKRKNLLCYQEDINANNYCNYFNTKSCTYSISGNVFPQCNCKEGFIGKFCEFNSSEINVEENMEIILSYDEINCENIIIISKIRGVIFFLEKYGIEAIQYLLSYVEQYIEKSINSLKKIINKNKSASPQIYDILELSLYFLKYKISSSQSSRNLQ